MEFNMVLIDMFYDDCVVKAKDISLVSSGHNRCRALQKDVEKKRKG